MRAVRVVLTLLVVAALAVAGWRAAQRMMDRQADDVVRDDPVEVATAWADTTNAGDVDGLVELAAERSDHEVLRTTHDQTLPALTTWEVAVASVDVAGNRATAILDWTAQPGRSEGTWEWTSELELIRGRGLWSADWEPSALHPELAPGWQLEVVEQPPARAPVLDREGRALSPTGANVEVGVQPGRLPDTDRLVSTVSSVLPEARRPLLDLLDRDDLVDDWYYPLVTVSAARAEEAWKDLVALPGLIRRDAEGGVGAAEAAPEIVGAVEVAEDGTRRGVSGLEELYDDRLTGSATTEVRLLDPEGRQREVLFTFQDDPAPPLVTTLDRDVQEAVDDAVIAVEDPVGVVVVDASTAGLLAVASRPSAGYARALEGRYPPATVAGLVPLAAALGQGASVQDSVACPSDAVVGGVQVTTRTALDADSDDETPAGTELADVLAGDCDVALARLGTALGDEVMREVVRLLGLDREPELPVAARGWSWPPAESEAALASWAVGHGRVETSALGAAQLAATVARGAPATPVVLAEEVVEDPTSLPQGLVTGLRSAMRTAGAAGPVQVPGARVAGFAARAGGVRGDPAPATGWWVGFVEGGGHDVAIAVVVEDDDDARAVTIAQRVLREVVG